MPSRHKMSSTTTNATPSKRRWIRASAKPWTKSHLPPGAATRHAADAIFGKCEFQLSGLVRKERQKGSRSSPATGCAFLHEVENSSSTRSGPKGLKHRRPGERTQSDCLGANGPGVFGEHSGAVTLGESGVGPTRVGLAPPAAFQPSGIRRRTRRRFRRR